MSAISKFIKSTSAQPIVDSITLLFRKGDRTVFAPCILVDGAVAREMTAWLAALADDGMSPSALEQHALALRRFAEYYLTFGSRTNAPEEFMRSFSLALDCGTEDLGWRALDLWTANRYFEIVGRFFDWLVTHGLIVHSEHPNPLGLRVATFGEQMATMARSKNSDVLHHLIALTKQGKGFKTLRTYRARSRWRALSDTSSSLENPGAGWAAEGMSLEDYVKLLAAEKSPRNRLLWLMLGAGAARMSEALNLFACDIHLDQPTGEALIALANPVKGKVLIHGSSGIERQQYLRDIYGMPPRCLLPRNHPLHAGWKGIMLGGFDDECRPQLSAWRRHMWTLVEWMRPSLGSLFWDTHVEYMRQRAKLNPQHPFYFVNTTRNPGAPLTRAALPQLLETACARAGIRPHSPHKLRHMYGIYLATIGMPIRDTQIMMRHQHVHSTLVYYKVKRGHMRERLERLAATERQHLLREKDRNDPMIFPVV